MKCLCLSVMVVGINMEAGKDTMVMCKDMAVVGKDMNMVMVSTDMNMMLDAMDKN